MDNYNIASNIADQHQEKMSCVSTGMTGYATTFSSQEESTGSHLANDGNFGGYCQWRHRTSYLRFVSNILIFFSQDCTC